MVGVGEAVGEGVGEVPVPGRTGGRGGGGGGGGGGGPGDEGESGGSGGGGGGGGGRFSISTRSSAGGEEVDGTTTREGRSAALPEFLSGGGETSSPVS